MPIKPPERRPAAARDVVWWLFIALAVLSFAPFFYAGGATRTLAYSEFETMLDAGKIKSVVISDDTLTGDTTEPDDKGSTAFVTQRVPPDLAVKLDQYHVAYSAAPRAGWFSALIGWILPPLIFVGIWMLFLGNAGKRAGFRGFDGGLLSIGKSRAKLFVETEVKVDFNDVAGADEAKAELRELVDFLKQPDAYGRLGAHVARGVLLVGPPGTGKTLLARAVAGEAGVPFYSTNGSEFVEMFVGVGAARVRDLFEQARKSAPCIIFIDELDALGRARGAAAPIAGPDEKEQTLNQLLAEMDGFDRSVAVIILAATNRPEVLDPALLRAGRFDRQVLVDRPDKAGRAAILEIHVKKLKTDPALSCGAVAALTPGFTGADLANLANEAAVVATRRGADQVSMPDFVAAIERIVGGLEKKSRILVPKERRIVAFHEMGHALVAQALDGADKVQKVSIIPRGLGALGYTMQAPTEDRFLMSRRELTDKMTVLLGGRAAEALVFEDISTGAADDLARATDMARGMVQRFGMDDTLGPVAFDTETGRFLDQPGNFWRPRPCSDQTSREIDQAVKRLLGQAEEAAKAILRRNRSELNAGAELLLQRETLEASELPRVTLERAAWHREFLD
jgi:cell division protease FtsH